MFFLSCFQLKLGEILKNPVILECSKYDLKKFARQRNVRLCSATSSFDTFVEIVKIRVVSLRNQRTLNQCCSGDFAAEFCNPAMMYRVVGVADTRHDSDVSRQLFSRSKILYVTDHGEHCGGTFGSDTLDALESARRYKA